MLLKFFIDQASEKIQDLLHYQRGAEELSSIIGDRLVSKLQDVSDELNYLSNYLDLE